MLCAVVNKPHHQFYQRALSIAIHAYHRRDINFQFRHATQAKEFIGQCLCMPFPQRNATFCNHKIITEVIHLLFYQALQNMFSTPFQWSYCYKFKHNCPTKCNCNTLLKKHIAYKICFIREIRVRSPLSYHSDSQQLFTMRM